ncbi:MAG: hypothetical protein ABIP68_01795 [Ferruginibacter sp.]
MGFSPLIEIQKLYLKLTDKDAYKRLKHKVYDERFEKKVIEQEKVNINHQFKKITTFKHSGNSGDIIYALPAIYALSKNGTAKVYLKANERGRYTHFHPLGNIMLSEKVIQMLKPLLEYQPQIELCEIYNGETIDYDLDIFRNQIFPLNRGSIIRWYFHIYAIFYNTSLPWLSAPDNHNYSDYIVIARSHRHRSPGVNYNFLKKFSKILFVGLPVEYDEMKISIPHLEYKPVNNFLEMASIIKSCKLFIGNQTFAFSLAEGLKTNRLLEVYYDAPNVIVEGEGAHDFIFQEQFEKAVEMLTENIY